MLLVDVARLADAALHVHALALLDHVRGLVRGQEDVGLAREGDVRAGGVALGAHLGAGLGGLAADVGLHPRQVMGGAERGLDPIEVRERTAARLDAGGGGAADIVVVGQRDPAAVGLGLDHAAEVGRRSIGAVALGGAAAVIDVGIVAEGELTFGGHGVS